MTVIAYRNGVIAADTASWQGNIYRDTASKIYRLGDGSLFAAAGWKAPIHLCRDWLNAGADPAQRPDPKMDKGDLDGLWVKPGGEIWSVYDFVMHLSDDQDIAVCGSHGEFLLGAMFAGASAEEAVALAVRHCQYAGGRIETARLNDG